MTLRAAVLAVAALTCGLESSAQERVGAFVYTPRVDALTDINQSSISTVELQPTLLRTASLHWRCQGPNQVELFVSADEFLTSNAAVRVQWRFDSTTAGPPRNWAVSTNGTAAFASSDDAAVFTKGARPASGVLLRVTDFRGVDYDLRFNLTGLTRALERLPCGAAVDRGMAATERVAQGPPPGAKFVGDPIFRSYRPIGHPCARSTIALPEAVFFATEEEAVATGYHPSEVCR